MANKTSTGAKVAGGLTLAAGLAAAAAASYYFFGEQGKKHQKELKAWSKKARGEMVSKIKQMKTLSKQGYDQAAKEILAKYKQVKNIDPKELQSFGMELKKHYGSIVKEAQKLAKKAQPVKKASAKK